MVDSPGREDLAARSGDFALDHPVWVATLAFVTVVIVGGLIAKLGAPWLASTARLTGSPRATELANARTTLLAVLAAGFAVVGAVYTGLNFGSGRSDQLAERFAAAVEQLGNDRSIYVRLAGIYSLRHLANQSRGYRTLVEEILDAYVADGSTGPGDPSRVADEQSSMPTDLRAAQRVRNEMRSGRGDLPR